MAALRAVLIGVGLTVLLSACSAEQVASSFRSWCRGAANCDDHSRQAQ